MFPGSYVSRDMRTVAIPFKKGAFRKIEGPEHDGVNSVAEFRWWLGQKKNRRFTYGQSPGRTQVRIVFAWADGKRAWIPVAEARLTAIEPTPRVWDRRYDKRWTITAATPTIPSKIKRLPRARPGQRTIVVTPS